MEPEVLELEELDRRTSKRHRDVDVASKANLNSRIRAEVEEEEDDVDVAEVEVEDDSTATRCNVIGVSNGGTSHLSAICRPAAIEVLTADNVGTSAEHIADKAVVALDTTRHG